MNLTRLIDRVAQVFLIGVLLLWVFQLVQLSGCMSGPHASTNVDTLLLSFDADRKQARVGEPVFMQFTIANIGQQPIVYESSDHPVMDITVQVVRGETPLVWSEQNPDKVSHRLEWQPREAKTIEWSWTPKPGDIYTGDYHDVSLTGWLWGNFRPYSFATGVSICASIWCR